MNRLLGPHPGVVAFLLGGGAFLAAFFGYDLVFPDPSDADRHGWDRDLTETTRWIVVGLGLVLWMAGGIMFGRIYRIHWLVAFLLQGVPVIGLILMRIFGKPWTAYEAWARDNPGLDGPESKRTYRPMKPLY